MKYASIVFLQDSEANEALHILNNDGEESAIDFLSQYDNGEYYDICDNCQTGDNDRTATMKGYILTYNNRLGYIGLEKIITD